MPLGGGGHHEPRAVVAGGVDARSFHCEDSWFVDKALTFFSSPTMYIDPGAGSVAFQILGAVIIAGLSTLSRVRMAMRGFFDRFRTK
jgi:hypothetical protein